MPGPEHLQAPTAGASPTDRPAVDLGPAICADDVESRRREWLLTNGRGGYACGSVANVLDRRYHAVLAAAIAPPDTRIQVLAKFDERLVEFWTEERAQPADGDPSAADCDLSSDVWSEGGLTGFGHRHLIRCRVHEGSVEHTWLVGRTRLTRRMVMPHGHDAIVTEYRLHASDRPIDLAVKAIGSNRLADLLDPGATWTPIVEHAAEDVLRLILPGDANGRPELPTTIRVRGGGLGRTAPAEFPWYRGYRLETEARRGYDEIDDHLRLAEVRATLEVGDVLRVEVAAGDSVGTDFRDRDPFAEEAARIQDLLRAAEAEDAKPLRRHLVVAADRFVVTRPVSEPGTSEPRNGTSIIAGYPWFADWGRDTMIALPGLCLSTGRVGVAREILATFARFQDRGLLPNRFPGMGSDPEYNTADAALLFIEAVGRTWRAVDSEESDAFLRSMLPTIDAILEAPIEGTLHGIRIDPEDGLLNQGEEGLQLTWMDARIDGKVVTPREGKAVELNGLLHSGLVWRSTFGAHFDEDDRDAAARADRIRASFDKFWMPDHGYLADVVDGPHGFDGSLRPNQLIATGCAHPPVEIDRARSALEICERELLTPVGLRTLAPGDPRYQGAYAGDQAERDAAYHMGTSWPWLLGPYLRTHLRVHGDHRAIERVLSGFVQELSRRCLDGIAEVHDGDEPNAPGGCLSQAWSVGEILAGLELAGVGGTAPGSAFG